MPRNYKRKRGARHYQNYTEEMLQEALDEMAAGDMTQKKVALKYEISIRTLRNKKAKMHMLSCGWQTALSSTEEQDIVNHVLAWASFGVPLDGKDL